MTLSPNESLIFGLIMLLSAVLGFMYLIEKGKKKK